VTGLDDIGLTTRRLAEIAAFQTTDHATRPWTPIDVIHRERLEEILVTLGISGKFDESERADINLMWHRLDPWPDSVRLRARLARRLPPWNGPGYRGDPPLDAYRCHTSGTA
jgi:hypothetical protein